MDRPHLHFTSLTPRELCGDIVESYRLAAQSLGYPTSYADRTFHPGAINVLFFFWDVPWEVIAPYHPHCIVVNFEPMVPGTHAWRENYLGVLQHCYLWEYSQSNFQRNRELRLRAADYVPLGYEEGAAPVMPLENILPDAEQDIDVIFFGTLTQRRAEVLNALMARGLRVIENRGSNWSIEERNGYLRRAKVALNFHNWENSRVVEIGRLSILFRQRKAVVCELYPDSEIQPSLRQAVVGAPYDGLIDAVLDLLADPVRRAALERSGLPLLSQLPQTDWVGPALERFLQWRSQQAPLPTPLPMPLPHVVVCMHIAAADDLWDGTFEGLARTTHPHVAIWITHSEADDKLPQKLQAAGLGHAHCIPLPDDLDVAAARNLMLRRQNADAIVFCERGDLDRPQRLERLAAFLAMHPEIDVVSHWTTVGNQDDPGVVRRCAEADHEIKADLLSLHPLRLGQCMVRRSFLDRKGVLHEASAGVHSGLDFLCRCAAAGARFASIAEVLQSEGPAQEATAPAQHARAAAMARGAWLARVFPLLTQEELALLGEIYAHLWPPESDFAHRLLTVLAKATAHAPSACGTEPETLTRVLRGEAVRLLTVFGQAGLIDQAWIDARFTEPEIAQFLAPASERLPLRPLPIRYD